MATKGKNKTNVLHRAGLVRHSTAPDWSFLYETSLIKSDKWNVGDKVELPDGRVFRYARSGAACVSGYGCNFNYAGAYSDYIAMGESMAVGDKELTIPANAHAVLAKNELRGGYIILFQGGADTNTTVRGIIGNSAAADGAAFIVYLDAAVTYAYVASTGATEVYRNPYGDLRYNAGYAHAGVPATYVSAALTYFWVQKSGVTWTGSAAYAGGNVAGGYGQYGCFWGNSGVLIGPNEALGVTLGDGKTSQYAGVTITGSNATDGPLLDMP